MKPQRQGVALTPLAREVAEKIRVYEMIAPGDRVVVGLSGGPDSLCLISLLAELREILGIRSLHAVHVNHGLRGEESDADQAYAEHIAEMAGASFDTVFCDIRRLAKEQRLGEEEAGRKLRYETFEQYRQRYGAQRIAVAHNRNDQAETVLMRLLRGTGVRGLSGISRIRDDGIVIRPLLDTSREEIEAYCRARGLSPRTDRTNLQPVYTRNRLRLELIPQLERDYNPRLQEALIRLADQAAEADEFIRENALAYLRGNDRPGGTPRWKPEEASLEPDGFENLHKAVADRVILEILEATGAAANVTADLFHRVRQLILTGAEPAETDLTGNAYVRKMYGKLWFLRRDKYDTRKLEAPVPLPLARLEKEGMAELELGAVRLRLSLHRSVSGNSANRRAGRGTGRASLDLDRIVAEGLPVFRNRRPGDRFRPIGMKGRKKLQDYFTDRKIPRQERDAVLLLARGHDIFLAGREVGADGAVTAETRRILMIEELEP